MYQLTVTYADGRTVTTWPRTFYQLSHAIDAAWETAGFRGYVVKGA